MVAVQDVYKRLDGLETEAARQLLTHVVLSVEMARKWVPNNAMMEMDHQEMAEVAPVLLKLDILAQADLLFLQTHEILFEETRRG
jgi:hypothetical protein